jgi:hypothetical protein
LVVGVADLGADDAVDQRRLARAGGPDQGHQQRRAGLAHPGQQVVVDLAEQLDPLGPGGLGAGGLEDQADVHDPAAQFEQGRFEQPGIDPAVPPGLRRLGPGSGPGRRRLPGPGRGRFRTGRRPLRISRRPLPAGRRALGTGSRALGTGSRLPGRAYRLLPRGDGVR